MFFSTVHLISEKEKKKISLRRQTAANLLAEKTM